MPELPSRIADALASGWSVVTANQRAARFLTESVTRRNLALGLASWSPPSVLAWDTWAGSLWQGLLMQGRASALLLNRTQEQTIWRTLIEADAEMTAAPRAAPQALDSLVDTAARAWGLLHDYRAAGRLRNSPDSADTRAFERWANAFHRLLRERNYLTRAQLPETLRSEAASGRLVLRGRGILLVGFDTKTPAQIALLDALQDAGVELDEIDAPAPAPVSGGVLTGAADSAGELTSAAHWARAQLTRDPSASIAVIVPQIDLERAAIDRVFRDILAPELEDIAAPVASDPFEFSLGIPLASTPIAAVALDLLRWATGPLPLDRVSTLLLSPHFAASPAEHTARATFDAVILRRHPLLRPEISLEALEGVAAGSKYTAALPQLLRHLRAIGHQVALASPNRSFAAWANFFGDLLDAAGWAPHAQLTSLEFQNRSKWESALDELATLDFDITGIASQVTFRAALEALTRIATQTLFAPESRQAPVQIMGPYESAGSTFDAIWFLHASDLDWPSRPAPNPLLAWHLQRDLQIPGTDAAHDADLGRRTTARIAASAPEVVFSYAREAGEARQRPSPVLAALALTSRDIARVAPAPAPPPPIALEAAEDAAPIPPPPDRVLEGGAGILEAQAACSFRAFAEKRLWSTALETPVLGLDPRARGTLIHHVLEDFWGRIKTQATLRDMSLQTRESELLHSIDAALDKHLNAAEDTWDAAYRLTERARLLRLLNHWLKVELERSPFAVKLHEAPIEDAHIGPLRMTLRMDRIDLTLDAAGEPDGGEILIDYKTGAVAVGDWLTERPDKPQLPLYAVLSEATDLAGVAFASLRPGKDMGLPGYESHKGILPRASRLDGTLDMQREQWHRILTNLAEDFYAGRAEVTPRKFPTTCTYCEQRLLCRLDPYAVDPNLVDDPDNPEFPGDPAEVGLG